MRQNYLNGGWSNHNPTTRYWFGGRIVLLPTAIAALIVFVCSIVAVDVFGKSGTISRSKKLLIVMGATTDAVLSMLFLSFLPLSTSSLLFSGILLGIISLAGFQAMLIPQRKLVWRIAIENIRRRKRQAILLIAGFIISSAIISSSFIIGDSLDATITHEVEATWTETDILISGLNPNTGINVAFSEELAERFWLQAMNDDTYASMLQGHMHGVSTTAGVLGPTGLGASSVTVLANNASLEDEGVWPKIGSESEGVRFATIEILNQFNENEPFVVVNQAFADELEAKKGDSVTLTLYRDSLDGSGRERMYREVIIYEVAQMQGFAQRGGTMQPSLFVDLPTAQQWLNLEGKVTRAEYAFLPSTPSEDIENFAEEMNLKFSTSVHYADAGLLVNKDEQSGGLTISSNSDFGRINATTVERLRHELSNNLTDITMLEAILAPIVSVEHQSEELLSLSDSTIMGLHATETALWHWSYAGFGFESFSIGDPWVWKHPNNGIVHGFALSQDGIGIVATSTGFVFADERYPDEIEPMELDNVGEAESIVMHEDFFYGIATQGDEITLYEFRADGEIVQQLLLDSFESSQTLDISLHVDDALYLFHETLLESSWHQVQIYPELTIQPLLEEPEISTSTNNELESYHEQCDAMLGIQLSDFEAWCTTDFGLLRWNPSTQTVQSIRLSLLSDVEGVGALPQLILAFDGDATYTQMNGSIRVNSVVADLVMNTGISSLSIHGAVPFAYGNNTPVDLTVAGAIVSIPGFENLTNIEDVFFALGSVDDVETLVLASSGERSLLLLSSPTQSISEGEQEKIFSVLNDASTFEGLYLEISAVQIESIEAAAESSKLLSGMFVVFGSFTIAAGILLSITILMLLFEVRKNEVATIRALGLRQSDARALFFFEGMILASLGGAFGAMFGGVLAWFVGEGFATIFASVGAIGFQFAWTLDSIFIGWFAGSLLSFAILWCMSWWNARLNIVRTLRDLQQFVVHLVPWYLYIIQGAAFGVLILVGTALFLLGFSSSLASTLVLLFGLSLITFITPILLWELPIWLRKRPMWSRLYRNTARNTVGVLGLSYLVWSSFYGLLLPYDSVESEELALILRGLIQVMAGVLLLSSLAPLAISAMIRFVPLPPRKRLLTVVALAHPLSHPVRTAAVVGMFSLTMFSVIVLAGYTSQFDHFTTQFVEEAEGEYEIMLTSNRARPLDFPDDLALWNLSEASQQSIDSVSRIYRAQVHLEDDSGQRLPYILRGFDVNFSEHGGLPLHIWDESLGLTEQEAWISIGKFDHIVFVDASFGLELATDGSGFIPLKLSIGDFISLIDFSNPENRRIVQVGGFLAQSSYLYSAGIWMNDDVVQQQFNGEITRMYISVQEEQDGSTMIQGKSTSEREQASVLFEELNRKFASEGVQVTLIYEDIQTLQYLVQSLLGLFESYLGIGLFVGIAGIGVVTFRNVSERRSSVGMLRALGVRTSEVGQLFLVEVTWIAVLGLFNGFFIAYLFHSSLHQAIWAEQGVVFAFPYYKSIVLLASSWFAVVCATLI
ncbi:MAG: FtsX-like permease family protein, partial [archaeon]|nr:FtsX-like permease family protein [archaeon]